MQPTFTKISSEIENDAEAGNLIKEALPNILPILPLRGVVVYPESGLPLTIGQERSIKLVDDVVSTNRLVGLVASHDSAVQNPGPDQLYKVGTVATVHKLFRASDGSIRLLVHGMHRMKIIEYTDETPYLKAKIELIPEVEEPKNESVLVLAKNAQRQFEKIANYVSSIPDDLLFAVQSLEDPMQIVYTIANFQRMSLLDAQELLTLDRVAEKLIKLNSILAQEVEILDLGKKIQIEARHEIEKVQRDYFLREQMKAIQKELGDTDDLTEEVENFKTLAEKAKLPEEAQKLFDREINRLSRLSPSSSEYGVIRTYLDWIVNLPWSKQSADQLDIANARHILDEDHYGLEEVKERLLEFLAVRKLKISRPSKRKSSDHIRKEREGVILCFVGPPGVGKTSLGRSIARALGREFVRISLGGVRDEAEIRGHRRTYIGALPGRIIQFLRRVESRNPVFMLDEIDKLGTDYRGDPASALLEVLDPEQNSEFRDHYLEVPFDLSQVMFITTANSLGPIPGPLRDRMEIIELSSYTEREKIQIAKEYLVPRQIRENGLLSKEVKFGITAIRDIIRNFTREAGVRNLEREIGGVCRKIVTLIAEGKVTKVSVTAKNLGEFLGRPKFFHTEDISKRTSIPGVATGLAWTPVGGDILFIESSCMPGSKGFQITGSLGEVMQESARAALTYVRSHSNELGIASDFFEVTDIHLHVPAGAQPKDGPSAGVTMVTSLVSLILGIPISKNVGMTGEVTLRGQVMPVGGIKEKILAAHRAGLKKIILPARNQPDLEDLPEEIKNDLEFIFAENVKDVLNNALSKPIFNKTK
jgi:ATP-dependent Lon protease